MLFYFILNVYLAYFLKNVFFRSDVLATFHRILQFLCNFHSPAHTSVHPRLRFFSRLLFFHRIHNGLHKFADQLEKKRNPVLGQRIFKTFVSPSSHDHRGRCTCINSLKQWQVSKQYMLSETIQNKHCGTHIS